MGSLRSLFIEAMMSFLWLIHEQKNGFRRFFERFLGKKSLEDMKESNRAASRDASLIVQLNGFHLFFIVLGHTIGAGIFVLLGRAALKDAGYSLYDST